MTADLVLTVWYRCHLCAPSVEWRDDEFAALGHLIGEHGMDLDSASDYLDRHCVDTTLPGLDSLGQLEGGTDPWS